MSETIAQNLEAVQERIYQAATRAGRSVDEVTLIAVSKTMPAEAVVQAMQAGMFHFGENRLEEVGHKMEEVAQLTGQSPHWHMIGHIQSRKAKEVAQAGFAMVHSVDNLKLAKRLDQFGGEAGQRVSVLLEINLSGEASKSGWQLRDWGRDEEVRAQFWQDVEIILALPHLHIEGLMTMAPYEANPEETRPVFRNMVVLQEYLKQSFAQAEWTHLSMGMTNDFEVAIEEGATLVRIGRAIFGER